MLTTTLRRRAPEAVWQLCQTLEKAGYRAWIVGGCVRDSLLAAQHGEASHPSTGDWDIATNARPEQVQRVFRRVIPTGIDHGTVSVLFGKTAYEVTTLRTESSYSDGRRPDSIDFVDDIVADLARRDFTINAIAYDSQTDRLIDPFGGIEDLKARRLKAVGDPLQRFAEDGLRVLRAARFLATLELHFDPQTEAAIEPSLESYRKVSAERIRDEWVKALKARKPSFAFEVMREHGMLAITAPELMATVGVEQDERHTLDVWGHSMRCLDNCPPETTLRLAAVLHDVGKPQVLDVDDQATRHFQGHASQGASIAQALLKRLRFSTAEAELTAALIREHSIYYESKWSDEVVRRWLARVTPERREWQLCLCRADIEATGTDSRLELARIDELDERTRQQLAIGVPLGLRDLAISGKDLLGDLGFQPGPNIGRVLGQLLDEVFRDPTKNTKQHLLEHARRLTARDSGEPHSS